MKEQDIGQKWGVNAWRAVLVLAHGIPFDFDSAYKIFRRILKNS